MSLYQYSADTSEHVRRRVKFFALFAIACFLCLWMRVWYLQIIKSQYFRGKSENNRVRSVLLPGYRGLIKDRNGETLVNIRPSFNLYIIPEDVKDLPGTLALLSQKIDFDGEKIKQNIKKALRFHNVLVKMDISRKVVAFIEENKLSLPGVYLKVEPLRNYVFGDLAAQTIGYLGEISKTRLKDAAYSSYKQGDMVGKNGLENIYEFHLRGKKGYKAVEVDVSGRELKILRKLPPKSGNHLILTLDARIQKLVEELMTGTPETPLNGSVVVMDSRTGEVLAITSKPSFDPNLFATGISKTDWQKLIEDKMHPLQNKAIDGQYPPGSIYKIITALAGLGENVVTPEATINCPGRFRLGRGTYRCWKKSGHGRINIYRALVRSCDVFFYTVGHRLGIDNLARYAREFGLGDYTRIHLKGEKPGLVPTSQWKLSARGEPWLKGETISAAIGQGYNLWTPLQAANMMVAVANGGRLLRPYLVKRIEDPDGNIVEEYFPELVRKVNIRPENMTLIRQALLGVVHDRGGTGYKARIRGIQVSGKTGTAQVAAMKKGSEKVEEKDIPYRLRDHAWFIAFAPFENPRIVVSVVVEHGGHGGAIAAPIAREIIKAYLKYYPAA